MGQEMDGGNGREAERRPRTLSPLFIRQLLKSKRGEVRAAVLMTLITMRDDPVMPDSMEFLPDARKALHDEDSGVRGVAAQVLGALGDKESLPQIKELLQDESEFVRNAVRDVLSKLEKAQQ